MKPFVTDEQLARRLRAVETKLRAINLVELADEIAELRLADRVRARGEAMTAELQIVDEQTGEFRAAGCPQCGDLAAKLAGANADLEAVQKENVRLLRRIDALKRDRDAERLQDSQRAEIISIFDYWRERCGHRRARFDGARFDLIKSRLRQFSVDELRMAIDGAAVSAYVDHAGKKHDRLGLVFESAERVEDFCNRYARWRRRNGGAA